MQPAMEAIYLRDGPEKGHKSSSSSFQDALAARRRENCTPSSSMMTPERDLLSSFLQTCAPAGGREGGKEAQMRTARAKGGSSQTGPINSFSCFCVSEGA